MGSAASTPTPVRKLDAAALLAELAEHAGVHLQLLGPASTGQVGAAYVRWHDGTEGVLTWWPDRSEESLRQLRRSAELLDLARSSGIPAPRYDLIAELPDSLAIVQERLPGQPPAHVDRGLVETMVAVNERCADLLADRTDVPVPEMYLDRSGPGFCVHESLRQYDQRTRRLLDRAADVEPREMTGVDLVHLDFHPGNVLTDGSGALTGIVDWDGLGRGDRHFGLVTLRFDTAAPGAQVDDSTRAWLDELLADRIPPETLRLYWTHMSLRLVDWSIRHFGAEDVTHWLEFAEAGPLRNRPL